MTDKWLIKFLSLFSFTGLITIIFVNSLLPLDKFILTLLILDKNVTARNCPDAAGFHKNGPMKRQPTDKACFNCGLDFGCFLTTFYFCWKTEKQYAAICKYKSPSNESKFNHSGHIYLHMAPQVTYCNLLTAHDEFTLVEYSEKNINNFLLTAARPLLRDTQFENLSNRLEQKTAHAANENDAEKLATIIKSNRTLTNIFAQLFYVDYKTFDIEIPQFIIDFELQEDDIF